MKTTTSKKKATPRTAKAVIVGRRGSTSPKGMFGSSFESFLEEQGTLMETTNQAIKRVLAYELELAMKEGRISKAEMARKMATSRSQVDRLLDPENDKIQLDTLVAAAEAVGRQLTIRLK
jgi:antitoxin HicB